MSSYTGICFHLWYSCYHLWYSLHCHLSYSDLQMCCECDVIISLPESINNNKKNISILSGHTRSLSDMVISRMAWIGACIFKNAWSTLTVFKFNDSVWMSFLWKFKCTSILTWTSPEHAEWLSILSKQHKMIFSPSNFSPMRAWGVKSRMCPPYPQRDRKRRLNGAVCRNHRIKRVVPCRC